MRRRHAATLSSQLLPLFGLDPAVYRLSFDFSHVEALREDVDALHARWRATFTAGGIDLYTFQEKIGLTPDEAYRGRYAKPSSPLDAGESGDEIKAELEKRRFDPEKHPRGQPDNAGQFVSVASSGNPAFEQAKAQAIQDLLPYTEPHPLQREAGLVLLKSDGSTYDSLKIGTKDNVGNHIPIGEPCAVLHTHDTTLAHSEGDINTFLSNSSMMDSYVVCRDRVFGLHKPESFQTPAQAGEALRTEIYAQYDRELHDVALEMIEKGETFKDGDDEAEAELIANVVSRIAKRYGVKLSTEKI